MGTTTEKLTYLQGTKDAIKNAIVAKGVEVPEGTTFRGYAEKVGEISDGTSVVKAQILINHEKDFSVQAINEKGEFYVVTYEDVAAPESYVVIENSFIGALVSLVMKKPNVGYALEYRGVEKIFEKEIDTTGYLYLSFKVENESGEITVRYIG